MFYNILVKADDSLEVCSVKPVDNVFNKTETLLDELQSFLDNTNYLYKSVSKEYSNARDAYYKSDDNKAYYDKLYRDLYAKKSVIRVARKSARDMIKNLNKFLTMEDNHVAH